jgi:CheY-like chemotaxis protein
MSPSQRRPPPFHAPIVVAEDDADDRDFLRDAFASSGLRAELRFVEDGEELLDYLLRRGAFAARGQSPRPSLVLLDLNMPRMDGRTALQRLRAEPSLRRVPVVVLSTSIDDADIDRCYELGANAYVNKPSRPAMLGEVARELMRWWFGTVELPVPRD